MFKLYLKHKLGFRCSDIGGKHLDNAEILNYERYFYFDLLFCFRLFNHKAYFTTTNALNGSWTPIKQEIGGNGLPSAAFQNQKLIINDTSYTFTAESVDKGVADIKTGKWTFTEKKASIKTNILQLYTKLTTIH